MHFSLRADLQNDFFLSFVQPFNLLVFQFRQFCCILFHGQAIRPLYVFSSMTLYQLTNHLSSFLAITPTFIIEPGEFGKRNIMSTAALSSSESEARLAISSLLERLKCFREAGSKCFLTALRTSSIAQVRKRAT